MVEAAESVLRHRLPVGWFAPNYKYLGEPYRELKRRLAPVTTQKNHERFLEILSGPRIDFWTLEDPDAGRSYKYGLVIIDEAAMVPDLLEIWDNAIRPTLSDYEGRAILTSTPKGMGGFREFFQRGVDGVEGYESWQLPTSSNPFIPPSEYDRERLLNEGLPERTYQQEYLAEFLDDAGGVFIGVDSCIMSGVREGSMLPVARAFAGVDIAQTTDFTVVSILDGEGKQIYLDRFNKLSWPMTIERIANALHLHRATCLVDATGVGSPIFEALRDRGLHVEPFVFTSQSKAALIESAVATIQRGDVKLFDDPTQTSELKAYEYQVTKSGNVKMSAPEGLHDDTVMALCLAMKAMDRPRLMVGVA